MSLFGKQNMTRHIDYGNGSYYDGEVKDKVPHGRGFYRFGNGDTYEGEFANGARTGQGKYTSTGGWWYEGGFLMGDFHGKGVYHFSNGDIYEGDFVKDKRTGRGKYISAAGWRYEGDFLDGDFHGKGIYYYSGGDVYEGDFVHDRKTGRGRYTSAKGWWYEGDFVNVLFEGQGTYHYRDGSVYEGHWVNNNRNGYGKYTSAKGWRYEGEYCEDRFHGKGTYYYADGDKYEGDFVNNSFHGSGKYTYANGTYFTGTWENDKNITRSEVKSPSTPSASPAASASARSSGSSFDFSSLMKPAGTGSTPPPARTSTASGTARVRETITTSAGDVFEGETLNGDYDGQGTYRSKKGWTYVGTFTGGEMTGRGKLSYADGDIYEGDLVKGFRQGQGTYYFKDGSIYEGAWTGGKRNGYGAYKTFRKSPLTGKMELRTLYEGMWKDSTKHGHGKETTYANDMFHSYTVEEGEWVNGLREGRFTYCQTTVGAEATATTYMGYYQNSKSIFWLLPYDESAKTYEDFAALDRRKRAGEAAKRQADDAANRRCSYYSVMAPVSIWMDSNRIDLSESDANRNGFGTYLDGDGDYIGTFKSGEASGIGIYRFTKTGGWYVGEWRGGAFHGRGVYFDGRNYHFGLFDHGICTTEREVVKALGQNPERRAHNSGATAYMSNNTILFVGDNALSMLLYADTSRPLKFSYSITAGLLQIGRLEGYSINDKNGTVIIAMPEEPDKACILSGEIVDDGPGVYMDKLLIDGTTLHMCGDDILSATDWRGNPIES